MSKNENLAEFLARYDPDGTRVIADFTPERDAGGSSPLVIVRHGRFAAVLALMPFDDHLCIDVFPFADEQDATAGVFGMTEGLRHELPATGTTSYGWPSAHLVSVLIGEQGGAASSQRGRLERLGMALQDVPAALEAAEQQAAEEDATSLWWR